MELKKKERKKERRKRKEERQREKERKKEEERKKERQTKARNYTMQKQNQAELGPSKAISHSSAMFPHLAHWVLASFSCPVCATGGPTDLLS